MCGFAIIIRRGEPINRDALEEAIEALSHRGPDARGFSYHTLSSPSGDINIGIGHARLSILDEDERSNQPFLRGDNVLAFNGEIFNFPELKQNAEMQGAAFSTSGDTEVLAHLLQTNGINSLSELNGQWAFANIDLQNGELLAARDRFGKKPFFYSMDDRELIIASTCKAVSVLRGERLSLDRNYCETFLRHDQSLLHGENSPFKEIRQLRPSHALCANLHRWRLEIKQHFDLADYCDGHPPESAALPDLLRDAVSSRTLSDRPVSMLLSGGIDSSLILAVLHSLELSDKVNCFIGDTGHTEDAKYAQRCADLIGINPERISIDTGAEAFGQFLHLCKHQEALFANHGMMSMSCMYREISKTENKVVIDGTGGDEIFGGYWDRQFPIALREAARHGKFGWLWSVLGKRALDMPFALRSLRWIFEPPSRHIDNSIFEFAREPVEPTTNPCPLSARHLSLTEALQKDLVEGRMSDWLWQNDRNAMSYGLEARSPLLDYRLSSFTKTDASQKFSGPYNKMELRKVFSEFVELPTQWRTAKQGFNWQTHEFLKKNHAAITDLIASSKTVPEVFARDRLLESAGKNPKTKTTRAWEKAMTIAGLEASLDVGI